MRETVEIVGVQVDKVDFLEAQQRVEEFLDSQRLNMIFTPNSEILLDAVKDRELEKVLNEAQLVIPDGIGVVIASKFYGTPLKERVTGVDMANKLLELAASKGSKVFFLGATQESIEQVAVKSMEKYPGLQIAGFRNGYFTEDEEEQIIDEVNESQADVLFVGIGAPRQEKLIYKYRDYLKVKVAIGIGGGLDIISGKAKRAPEFYQKAGLEWLHRLMMQPSRFMRMTKLPKFILLAFVDALTSKH